MVCSHCETQLPDEARFCWQCGEPQQQNAQADASKWETCEIVTGTAGMWSTRLRFWARAMGPNGEYNVGSSREFSSRQPAKDDARAFAALNDLLARLVLHDGWERIRAKGPDWYSHRFHRPIAAPSVAPLSKITAEAENGHHTSMEGRT